jgi:parallel beta-helix repeat protein
MRRVILLAVVSGLVAAPLFSLGTSSSSSMGDQSQSQLRCTMTVRAGESIQAAIDAAEEGAVICLGEGTWVENLVIGKSLTLRGFGPGKSVIKGLRGYEPVIYLYSDAEIEVTVEGLTIAEAKGREGVCAEWPLRCPHGLSLSGRVKATIQGNTISENENDGIFMWMWDSAQATITGNTISGNGNGISMLGLGEAQATITANTISRNKWRGISMSLAVKGTIRGNTISENWYGISISGVSARATIRENFLLKNELSGISVEDSAQAAIEGNIISRNSWYGILMRGEAQAEVENNTIQENGGCGIYADSQAKVTGTPHHLETNGAELCGNVPASLRVPLAPETGETKILYPGEYETLQHAIDAMARGGTIIIASGKHQGGLTIWKPLTLKGSGSELTTLKGRTDKAPVISIIAEAKDVKVEGLKIEGGSDGLRIYGSAAIWENTISGNESVGIFIGGLAEVTITGNTFSENGEIGISVGDSAQAAITTNTISGNGEGITVGESARAIIQGNSISGNENDGIHMGNSARASISWNTISGNRWEGISVKDSAQATIKGNKITDNGGYGVALYQQPCFLIILKFGGALMGWMNEISGNKKGEVCPVELEFLMTESGGCYGPLCR